MPPISDDERRIERALLEQWEIYDAATGHEAGILYPDATGTSAKFDDVWNFHRRVDREWLDDLKKALPAAWWLIQSTRYSHSEAIAAYIAFMVERMIEIRRILKSTGSIYLHCDHAANAYLRQMMDAIFGPRNFRNEIVWGYRTGGISKNYWPRKHDTILFYVKSAQYVHQPQQERVYYEKPFFNSDVDAQGRPYADVYIRDVWDQDIKPLINTSGERTGYPTQKPQALARRIIEASLQTWRSSPRLLRRLCICASRGRTYRKTLDRLRYLTARLGP